MIGVEAVRRRFAAELAEKLALQTPGLVGALASVPREFFLGPGPWLVLRVPEGYTSTPDADPVRILQDVPVALDAARLVNSGAPSVAARMIEALAPAAGESVVHMGCGTGYYSAILAEVVGAQGRVLAIEIDPELAARAKRNLRGWKQIEVVQGDAVRRALPPVDRILISAGATHLRGAWLDAIRAGGALVAPLTGVRPPPPAARFGRNLAGEAVALQHGVAGWSAHLFMRVGLSPLLGGRDIAHERLLAEALTRGDGGEVRSLRRDAHEKTRDCWLHAADFCFSKREPSLDHSGGRRTT